MKRLTNTLLLAALTLSISAQEVNQGPQKHKISAREELRANKHLSGGNYLDYDRQLSTQPLTPAPEGYEPFYMSHYGRHGSRWLISDDSYTSVTEPLQKARQAGKLTAEGEQLLERLETFLPTTIKRLGDLTTVGERQHHGIAKRMVQNFPEIFKHPNVPIDARSTVVVRCILSMTAECEELAAANPSARIHNDVSESLQYYLNASRDGIIKSIGRQGRQLRKQFNGNVTTDRLTAMLFNDTQWASDSISTKSLMHNLFEIVTNMQSHDDTPDLFSLFTEDEIYELWRIRNIGWYLDYGPAPQTESLMPFNQRHLLRNIIETTDTVTQTQATLRFGHEVCVMPLACLLELGNCGAKVTDLDQLDDIWRNYNIFPMGCNIQLVFYRPTAQGSTAPVLVKALLNEREVSLPIATSRYPYYDWAELRQYYLDKLAQFDARNQQFLDEQAQQQQQEQTTKNTKNEKTQKNRSRFRSRATVSRRRARVH